MAKIKLTLEGYKIISAGTKVSAKGNYMNVGLSEPDKKTGEQSSLVIFTKQPQKLGAAPKLSGSTFDMEQTCFMEGE